ncbi:MAG: acetylpolyamine amidohydrolase [Candidatus Krumholzibacteriia bacterium]
MFLIRRIPDDALEVNRSAIDQAIAILNAQFPDAPAGEFADLAVKLRDPLSRRLRSILLVAEDRDGRVQGCAIVLHEPNLQLVFLDFLAAQVRLTSRGIGGALYTAVRETAVALGAPAVLCECDPDSQQPGQPAEVLAINRARMRFYENFGARPVVGTDFERPLGPDSGPMPVLVCDPLDHPAPPRRRYMRAAVQAVLERRYARVCSPEYVREVVASFRDDPVRLREPRYVRKAPPPIAVNPAPGERIAMVVNDRHDIHHVSDRGYVEAPVRVNRILAELANTSLCERLPVRSHSLDAVRDVHDPAFVSYLRRVCLALPPNQSVYPYVFPLRNTARPPQDLALRAGYFCMDTFTPLSRNAFLAARRAVDCVLTASEAIRRGRRLAYALVRPPGHHAERRVFGGFCYFNNAAIGANDLLRLGRVAMLDLDYHHGNGQQNIFYARDDVLTVSIHGHPRFAYPYFTGFSDEQGEGAGRGYNVNVPLPEQLDGTGYREALDQALRRVQTFKPTVLVVCLGLDTGKGDPTGTWSLGAADFTENGRRVGALGLPTLVVQEGGYRTANLGRNARCFLEGLALGAFQS